MTRSEAHARKYAADHYKGMFGGASHLDFTIPYDVQIPCPETVLHMTTLRDMAAKATRILELGPFLGTGSTLAFRAGVEMSGKCKQWVTVDVVDHMLPWMKPHMPFWNLVIGDSTDGRTWRDVQVLMDAAARFDLIFIDTVHTYEHLKKELDLWSPLADRNCTWLFHDTWMLGEYNPMTDAIKEFAAASDGTWEYADISKQCSGLGALIPCQQ